jgi:hypothetical protein
MLVQDKSVYEMGDSDEVDTMEDAMLKIGVVSQVSRLPMSQWGDPVLGGSRGK